MTTQNLPVEQLPYLYAYGCIASNNSTTPNTKLDMTSGQVRDSNDNVDIVESAITIDFTINGFNGLDTGSIAASKMYSIFAISDSSNKNPSGYLASLSLTTPLMPYGYDSYRIVAFWSTDSSSHLLLGYMNGTSNNRIFYYDAPQATAVVTGNATSYTAVVLTNLVPALDKTLASIAFSFTPGAASRVLNLTPGNGTGNAVTSTGQVTSVPVTGNALLFSNVISAVPTVKYKVSNSGDAAALAVSGFNFFI